MNFTFHLYRWLIGFTLLLVLVFMLNPFGAAPSNSVPVTQAGIIDLSRWQTNPQDPVNLDGQWLFYWQQLLDPAQLATAAEPARLVYVPGYWSTDSTLPNEGHGTYSLTITGLKAQQYALMIPTTYTANKIWLDDVVVAQSGRVGSDAATTDTRWHAHEIFFTPTEQSVRLTVQMASYDHPHFDGGITRAITLGTAQQVHFLRLKTSLTDFVTVAVLLILGFYQLIVFWQRPLERVPLYFAGCSILIALGSLLTRNSFLYLHWFDVDFAIYQRLIYVCQSFVAVLFVKYVGGMYPNHCNPKMVKGLLYVSMGYFVLMMLLTPNEPAISRHLFSGVMVVTILYAMICVVRAVIGKQKGAEVFLLGLVFVTLSNLYEILLANDILHPLYFNKDGPASIAVGVFVLTQTWLLATRHSDTLNAKIVSELVNVEKNRFFAAASHDLRQPIYALQLLHNVLADKTSTAPMAGLINDLRKNTEQLENLVENLLEIAQIDLQGLKVVKDQVSMQSFFDTMACEYAVQAHTKGLEFDVQPTPLYGLTDSRLLARIVGNLLTNAIRYTQSGKVTLACRQTSEGLLIEVTDTGPGMTTDQQIDIFKAFYQLNATDSTNIKGLGLGLSIVKRLANLLQHPVNVLSTPGQGSIFSVQIEAVASPPLTQQVNKPPVQTAVIAILEDDNQVLNALVRQIEVWGFKTIAATNSAGLQAQLNSCQVPDLIVSDYRLANNDNGIDAIEALRQRFATDIPALITTGEQQADIIQRIEQFDCQWCRKPITPSHLFERINRQLA